jgi:hypothetical protein
MKQKPFDVTEYECYDCHHYKPDPAGGGGIGGFGSCPWRADTRAWSGICAFFKVKEEQLEVRK